MCLARVSDQQRLVDLSEKLLKKGEGIVGELGDDLLQDKGELLPREYRRVIEQYLTIISEMENSQRQQQDQTK
jgi:hypothetical protein